MGNRLLGGDRDDGALEERLKEFTTRLHGILDGAGLQESFIRYCLTQNPVKPVFRLPSTWTLRDDLTPATHLCVPDLQKVIVRFDEEQALAVVHVRGQTLQLKGLPREVLHRMFFDRPQLVTGADLMALDPALDWAKLKQGLLQLFDHGVLILADHSD